MQSCLKSLPASMNGMHNPDAIAYVPLHYPRQTFASQRHAGDLFLRSRLTRHLLSLLPEKQHHRDHSSYRHHLHPPIPLLRVHCFPRLSLY